MSNVAPWIALAEDEQTLGAQLWEATRALEGWANDPRMISSQLFARLWSNARSFNLLWANHLTDDAEIILRSGVECAICLINLRARPTEFATDLFNDAAHTTAGQIPIWAGGDPEWQADATASAEEIFGAKAATGKKHPRLDWKTLAEGGGLPALYDWHKALSGTAAHVTGLSLMKHIARDGDPSSQEWREFRRLQSLSMSCGILFFGMNAHAALIGATELTAAIDEIGRRLNALPPIVE